MLRSVESMKNHVLLAEDGEIGRCKDVIFDDRYWTVRYMLADTGKWLPKRKVLISPISLGEPDWQSGRIPVRLTKEQIEKAPGLDEDAPVSRQHEEEYFRYYGWSYYWTGVGVWGMYGRPRPLSKQQPPESKDATTEAEAGKTNLRSANEVIGYHIQATDGEIGHVEDFIIDDETWTLRYMVIDTRNWLPGRKVLISPAWTDSVDWAERRVSVVMTRKQVEESPEYDPGAPVNREYEARLYDYYGRPLYWD